VSDKELLEILSDDQVDGVMGGEKTISEADLAKVLDRQKCLDLFKNRTEETNLNQMPSEQPEASAKASSKAGTSKKVNTGNEEGYELIEEEGDGQGGLIV
jgi:hypothetical protein